MTQDEIIRMATEAGFLRTDISPYELLERFAALVAQNYMAKACGGCVIKQCYKRMDAEIEAAVLAEREACAQLCAQLMTPWDENTPNSELIALRNDGMRQCAAAIRARGTL